MAGRAGIGKFLCVEQQLGFLVNGGGIKPALGERGQLKCREIEIVIVCFQSIQALEGKHEKKDADEQSEIKTVHWPYLSSTS